jgi:LmbE family N-acetylglucosaminyl deacetylase
MKILAIGAHPDDIELGCGGLLIKSARQGHDIYMYTLTHGEASGDPKQRISELKHSANIIGAKRLWIDTFEDTHLSICSDLINHIEYFVKRSEADIVLTHSLRDTHHDHRAIAASTIESGRYVPNILSYEIPLTKDFLPQIYYDISDVINEKVKLIELFWSQQTKLYLKSHAIKGLAEYRALQSRLNTSIDFVEAFEIVKIGLDKEFKLLNIPNEKIPKNEILERIIADRLRVSDHLLYDLK